MKLKVRASETKNLMTSGDKVTTTTLTWLKGKAVAEVLVNLIYYNQANIKRIRCNRILSTC